MQGRVYHESHIKAFYLAGVLLIFLVFLVNIVSVFTIDKIGNIQ